jgi:hypothetical protein
VFLLLRLKFLLLELLLNLNKLQFLKLLLLEKKTLKDVLNLLLNKRLALPLIKTLTKLLLRNLKLFMRDVIKFSLEQDIK